MATIDVYKEWLGIPEGPRPPDHYQLLRLVQFEDDVEKIRKNYKKLNGHVRKYATGKYSNESQTLLNEIAKAMLCLTDAEAKQDYDRSLGRVIDDRDESGRRPMTSYLQDEGLITTEQAKQAKQHADRSGLTVRDAIVQLKMADHETAARAYANELGRSYMDLADLIPDNDVLDQVPRNVVRRHTCLPLFIDQNAVVVACADEPDHELEDEIRLRFGLPIRPVIASGKAINNAITTYYAPGLRKEPSEIAKVTSKVSGKGTNTTTATKLAAPKKAAAEKVELTDEEKSQRRQLGLILICWSFIVPFLLDTFVLWDNVWKRIFPKVFENVWFISTVLVGIPMAFVFYNTHVKKKP